MSPEGKWLPPLGDLNVAEAVLKAWASCQPAPDCTLPEKRLPDLLQAIATHVPGCKTEKARFFARQKTPEDESSGVSALRLYSACTPYRQGTASFIQRAQAVKGKVHFPYFWRAFSEAVRVAAQPSAIGTSGERREELGGLAVELEALRDNVLSLLEDSAASNGGRRYLSMSALAGAVRGAVSTSVVPDFWRSVQGSVHARGPRGSSTEISLEEVSALMLLCLRGAVALRRDRDLRKDVLGKVRSTGSSNPGSVASERMPAKLDSGRVNKDADEGIPVYLNIYDVSHKSEVQWFNSVLANLLAPVKFGGAFHAGVEVHGLEWSYGATRRETLPGIICVLPRADPNHHFRETVYIGRTKLPMDKVGSIITDLIEDYPGNAYDVLRRNCCHFADDFCHRLGVGAIPSWVQRLARFGAGADGVMQTVAGIVPSELLPVASLSSLSSVSCWDLHNVTCAKEWPASLVSAEPVMYGKDATCPGPL